ncbi:PREDICTED: neutrophil cytosol factor 1-like [Amphimedon queenslandica]|uniref:SH3 and PX domain-containing protein 2A n=1 Tax=Amphimedon queenslandica TaxID=400682 RepID=A0A1X7VAE4_AMPQE|nr:PREDICTED: neutrophil cytosol factor 1-like [Amphimedon queenslandica]|eukprot:XP_011402812.1 PREDICTED: neutrophil cytosol factor 1-like [Amphimedon queenslandica]
MPRNRDGPKSAVNHVVVTGYEKRRNPSKHYVFVIDVTWDNDERFEVLRRYSDFFTLQETLKIVFHESPNRRSLPTLPKRKFLGRSHVESVAEARLEALNQYCQSIIRMDESISRSKHVVSFFLPKVGDRKQAKLRLSRPASLHPQKRPLGNSTWEEYCVIADFKGEKESQLTADSGDQVIVMNKDPSGWCLVERKGKIGWIPESYLKKTKGDDIEDCLGMIGPPEGFTKKDPESTPSSSSSTSPVSLEIEAQEYMAIDAYKAQGPGQINFEEGEIITVLDKLEDGWWFVTKDDEEGWVPCGYLEPVDSKVEEEIAVSSLDIEKYRTVASYTAEEEDEISFEPSLTVEVLQKSLTGWWLIRCEGKVGVAPATYLKKIEEGSEESAVIDSGIDSGSEKQESPVISSFAQAPRQKTVRKKRFSTGKPKGAAKPEAHQQPPPPHSPSPTPSKSQSPQRRKGSEPILSRKSPIPERKVSEPDSESPSNSRRSPKPPRVKSQSQDVPVYSNRLEMPYTPPRPRQSKIDRAWRGTENKPASVDESRMFSPPSIDEEVEEEEEGKKKRGFSPSRLFGRRSPSPRSPQDLSPRSSPFQRRRDDSKSLSPPLADQNRRSSSDSSPPGRAGSGGANPFTQTMVDSMLKYILASEDETLKAALKDAIRSDSKMMEELRK